MVRWVKAKNPVERGPEWKYTPMWTGLGRAVFISSPPQTWTPPRLEFFGCLVEGTCVRLGARV